MPTLAQVAFAASLLVLDPVIHLQHVMVHAVPVSWRQHRMHHADLEFDVSTGLRFHPAEVLLSMGIKLAAIAALGPPAAIRSSGARTASEPAEAAAAGSPSAARR